MRVARSAERRQSGSAVVEMAVVLPLFIALTFGTLEAARLGSVAQLLNNAARDGCRVAITQGTTADGVQSRINAALSGSGVSVSSVDIEPGNWASAANETPITVSLSVPYSRVSWLPMPLFLGGTTVTAAATMGSQRN